MTTSPGGARCSDRAPRRLEATRPASRGSRQINTTRLPSSTLGERIWGISRLSAASALDRPKPNTHIGTQVLLGHPVKVWQEEGLTSEKWFQVQSADGYLAWMRQDDFVRCTLPELQQWQQSPLLIVTAMQDRILAQPRADATLVSEVVVGNLVKRLTVNGGWFKVQMPDGRAGYLSRKAAENYADWRQTRNATAETIERTARTFLGYPYLWGGNSPKGLDCSGFTKLVFFLNGIDLKRNADHQAQQGMSVPLDPAFSALMKGDLLFFGSASQGKKPERIVHVGLYLGDKLFIHSSGTVHISSLDPQSHLRDEKRIRTLVRATRIL